MLVFVFILKISSSNAVASIASNHRSSGDDDKTMSRGNEHPITSEIIWYVHKLNKYVKIYYAITPHT